MEGLRSLLLGHFTGVNELHTGEVLLYGFDSLGYAPEPSARGRYADAQIELHRTAPRGHGRTTFASTPTGCDGANISDRAPTRPGGRSSPETCTERPSPPSEGLPSVSTASGAAPRSIRLESAGTADRAATLLGLDRQLHARLVAEVPHRVR